ncbi:MAG: divergent polysaccharide deacetylase family protein [Candidatus Zophobacter franzmannii]|nr:divergent polysaccharide deacetylase family protein [Candidatus Zophobacter franzmannii]
MKKKKYANNYSWIWAIVVILIIAIPITCSKRSKDKPEYKDVEEPITHSDSEPKATDAEKPIVSKSIIKHGDKKLAIIIDDFGQTNNSLIKEFFELPLEVTFAIIPDLPRSKEIMIEAMLSNREVIIHVPMEPESYPKDNPGENAIFTHLSDEEIKSRMNYFCDEISYAIGINNHMGSKATSDKRTMEAVCSVLSERNMFFIDSFTTAKSVAQQTALRNGVPTNRRHIFLDVPNSSLENAKAKLGELNKKNKKYNPTIVISHCLSRKKLAQLKEFLRLAKADGYELVPISQVIKQPVL